jgi:hypothetical protein
MRTSLAKPTDCLSPTCTRCGSVLASRGQVNHTRDGMVVWTWVCGCGRRRRVSFTERGRG